MTNESDIARRLTDAILALTQQLQTVPPEELRNEQGRALLEAAVLQGLQPLFERIEKLNNESADMVLELAAVGLTRFTRLTGDHAAELVRCLKVNPEFFKEEARRRLSN